MILLVQHMLFWVENWEWTTHPVLTKSSACSLQSAPKIVGQPFPINWNGHKNTYFQNKSTYPWYHLDLAAMLAKIDQIRPTITHIFLRTLCDFEIHPCSTLSKPSLSNYSVLNSLSLVLRVHYASLTTIRFYSARADHLWSASSASKKIYPLLPLTLQLSYNPLHLCNACICFISQLRAYPTTGPWPMQ